MLRRIFFASIIIICGCVSEDDVPGDVIPMDKMVGIIADINLAEGAIKAKHIGPDSAKTVAPFLYEMVFKKHKISREEFDRSMDYYLHHPEQFENVYEDAITVLSKMESGIEEGDQKAEGNVQ